MVTSHPNAETLIAYAAGELGPEESNTVSEHATGCEQCAGTVERYRLVQAVLKSARNDAPRQSVPAAARAKALALFRNPFLRPRFGLEELLELLRMKLSGQTEITLVRLLIAVVLFFLEND